MFDFGATGAVDHLIVAVIQSRDLEAVSNALALRNLPSTRVKSTGSFLRQRNHTLLIGVPDRQLEEAVVAISTAARERAEFVSALPGIGETPVAEAESVRIHGATVFVFAVERFEAI
jgi:uncharacterized protein YaaQ